jgi:signal transduction histidine kinase
VPTPDARRGAATAKADGGTLLGTLERLQAQRPHLQVLISLLGLAFVVTGILAWQAWAAARSERESVEYSLLGHSEATVNRWSANIAQVSFDVLVNSFKRADHQLQQGAPPEDVMSAIEFARDCDCDSSLITTYYWLDFDEHQPAGHLDHPVIGLPELRAALAGDVGVLWMADTDTATRVGIRPLAGRDELVIFMIRESAAEEPLQAYGLLALPQAIEPLLAASAAYDELLPPSQQRGVPVEHMFELIGSVNGRHLFRTEHVYPATYATSVDTRGAIDGISLTAIVNPDAAGLLIVGGLPGNRLPLLLALLALTAALTTTAVFLLRREAELTRLRSEFVASVSHELRTPLAQIRMFAETLMLGRTRSDAERRKSLEIIDQEARRLSHLVENVLLYAKSERHRTVISPRPTPLGQEVAQAVESFGPFCRSRDSRIRCELESDVIANVDRFALRQILLNLFDNALKYGPSGQEITVGLAVFDGSVRLWVDDEGPGIPPAQWARVFEPFYRVAGEAERSVAGSGIGLAVVRELATLHGGRAWAEDAPGGGARVMVELPNAHVSPRPSAHIGAVA